MPQKDNEENLVFDHGTCDNGASIVWDNEAWGPMVKNLSKNKTKCSLYFEEKNSMVDLTLASCDNHITATANKVEGVQITKYEYQIDEGDWFTGSETQEFNDQTVGNHTIKLRVTNDNSEVSKEVKRSITINEQRKVEIYGKQIPIATCNNGLYEVSHDVSEISTDWNKKEYRFAGDNPKNYVEYNNEIWRIIGLVNAKTKSGIEQRLKIVRTDGVKDQKDFGNYSWDRSEDEDYTSNWSTSKLKDMLNGIYYESKIGECYIGDNGSNAVQNTCDFSTGTELPKGLDEVARSMIDKEVIWTLGGMTRGSVIIKEVYEVERGDAVYDYNPLEWSTETDGGEKFNGIGLIYPSDFGYAIGGSVRNTCLEKNMSSYGSDGCSTNDWLTPSNFSWTLMPNCSREYRVFRFYNSISTNSYTVFSAYKVLPTLYLSSNVKIVDGNGDINSPFVLSIQ